VPRPFCLAIAFVAKRSSCTITFYHYERRYHFDSCPPEPWLGLSLLPGDLLPWVVPRRSAIVSPHHEQGEQRPSVQAPLGPWIHVHVRVLAGGGPGARDRPWLPGSAGVVGLWAFLRFGSSLWSQHRALYTDSRNSTACDAPGRKELCLSRFGMILGQGVEACMTREQSSPPDPCTHLSSTEQTGHGGRPHLAGSHRAEAGRGLLATHPAR
jgi:hypothetical protein